MIDIHSHIICGVDDGSLDLKMSEEMARKAIENGITHIIATPHFNTAKENILSNKVVEEKVKELNEHFKNKDIKLTIYTGMELYASNDMPEFLAEGKALTLANSRYALIDFSIKDVPYFLYDLVYRISLAGYIPLIAHPERNSTIKNDITIVKKLIDMGAYIQIDKGSILGEFGEKAKKTSIELLRKGYVNCIATDMHNTTRRSPVLDGMIDELSKVVDEDQINVLLNENPKRILDNKENLILLGEGKEEEKNSKRNLKIASFIIMLILITLGLIYSFNLK